MLTWRLTSATAHLGRQTVNLKNGNNKHKHWRIKKFIPRLISRGIFLLRKPCQLRRPQCNICLRFLELPSAPRGDDAPWKNLSSTFSDFLTLTNKWWGRLCQNICGDGNDIVLGVGNGSINFNNPGEGRRLQISNRRKSYRERFCQWIYRQWFDWYFLHWSTR